MYFLYYRTSSHASMDLTLLLLRLSIDLKSTAFSLSEIITLTRKPFGCQRLFDAVVIVHSWANRSNDRPTHDGSILISA
jgi:hypothetical protein